MLLTCRNFKTKLNNKDVVVDVYKSGRRGTLAPTSYYYKYNGRWISPYEMSKRGWALWSLNDLFKITYSEAMVNFILTPNPLFDSMPKDYNKGYKLCPK